MSQVLMMGNGKGFYDTFLFLDRVGFFYNKLKINVKIYQHDIKYLSKVFDARKSNCVPLVVRSFAKCFKSF